MAQVCRKVAIEHTGHIPEWKVVWHGIHPKVLHRTSSIHVYAEFCGPSTRSTKSGGTSPTAPSRLGWWPGSRPSQPVPRRLYPLSSPLSSRA